MSRSVPAARKKTPPSPAGKLSKGWLNSDLLSPFLHCLWPIAVAGEVKVAVRIQALTPAGIPALTPADAQGTAVITAAAITANIVVAGEASTITVIIAPPDTVVIAADTAAAS